MFDCIYQNMSSQAIPFNIFCLCKFDNLFVYFTDLW